MKPANATQRLWLKAMDRCATAQLSIAYRKGWQAAVDGYGLRDCPYAQRFGGVAFANAWYRGWRDGVVENYT